MFTKPTRTDFPSIKDANFVCREFWLWILVIFLIIFRLYSVRPPYKDNDKIRLTARVSSEPLVFSDQQRITIERLKIYLPLYPEINYGDTVVVEGVVSGDKLKSPKLVKIFESQNFLFRVRNKIINFYKRSLPEPHSSLIAGVTLGSKSALPEKFWADLKKTGTAHVVVASGMNVTLVAGFLMGILVGILERKKAILAALAGVWVYALLAGFEAPIIRAAVMGSVAFSAQAFGKLSSASRALLISAAIMLLIYPFWIYDLGFILSFVATASLILFEAKVRRLIYFVPSIFKEGFSTSLAAQIGVAPIIFLAFGQFNPLSPLINALVLWTVPMMTVIGMLAGVIGGIFPILGRPILLLAYPMTLWFVTIIGMSIIGI